jgi:response regulator of citrate/malate metabolism
MSLKRKPSLHGVAKELVATLTQMNVGVDWSEIESMRQKKAVPANAFTAIEYGKRFAISPKSAKRELEKMVAAGTLKAAKIQGETLRWMFWQA